MLTWALAWVARHRRFVTFCAVGASGVLVNLAVFSLALYLLEAKAGAGWLVDNAAVFVGWLVSVLSNFALNDRLTFRQAEGYGQRLSKRLASYYTSAFAAFVIQWLVFNGLLWVIKSSVGDPLRELAQGGGGPVALLVSVALHYQRAASNLAGIGVATVANYLLAKHWVFKGEGPAAADAAETSASPADAASSAALASSPATEGPATADTAEPTAPSPS